MNTKETAQLLAWTRAVWSEMYVDRETIAVWQRALDDVDADDARDALDRHVKLSPFAPRPADIRRNIVEIKTINDARWEDGWAELTSVAKTYGTKIADDDRGYLEPYAVGPPDETGRVDLDHPDTKHYPGRPPWPGWSSDIVERAVQTIGYRAFLLADESQYGTLRAQFRDSFSAETLRRSVFEQTGMTDMRRIRAETCHQRAEIPKSIKDTLDEIQIGRGEICEDEHNRD